MQTDVQSMHPLYRELGGARCIQILCLMPLMKHISHDQSVIELNRTIRKTRPVRKEARMNLAHCQGANAPIYCPQEQAVQALTVSCDRISKAASLEEGRCFG